MALRSEQDFLTLIDRYFPPSGSPAGRQAGLVRPEHVLLGRGDDCAVLRCPGQICMSADLFLESVHFRRSYFLPEDVGYKALAVNVSDISAMGARPLGFCLQLFGPSDVPQEWWEGLFAGMAGLADSLHLPLVGGDLSRGPNIGLALTVWGEAVEDGRFLSRQTARPGDHLFLVGEVGLARAGLMALENAGRQACRDLPRATSAHLRPVLHVEQAMHLGKLDFVRGLMDVSDGLAMDLPRFLPCGLGADLDPQAVDIDPEVVDYATRLSEDPLLFALAGGEDYPLLGVAAPEASGELTRAVPDARVIGRVVERPGLFLAGRPAQIAGFDHFTG
ncbi:thiamine-phosphate kinase [Desulfocurvibacter africanus]|uniref:thiamine-phosphate kinase n=1 Tax=Desulfocurvibacter africanus TaxID=873 RepID=UPI002FD8C9BE